MDSTDGSGLVGFLYADDERVDKLQKEVSTLTQKLQRASDSQFTGSTGIEM
jgi:hypothetical protein